jgi:heptosyltransferase-1
MGDILHTLPAVATLRHSFPQARISWAVKPRWAVLLRGNPHVDELLEVEWPRPGLGRFDLAIDFQGLIKSAAVAKLARAERVAGFDQPRETPARLFYTLRVATAARHVVDRNLELAAAIGAGQRRVEFPIPEYAAEGELPDEDFVLASPLAGWKAKQWPPEYYTRLAELIRARWGWPLVLNCGPAERVEVGQIVGCVVNASSVEGLIGVTRRARAVVGVDSGPLHLAAALGKPGVALFGPTDPERNGPYSNHMAVLRAPGAVTTYERHEAIAPSMEALAPEQVLEALEKQLCD